MFLGQIGEITTLFNGLLQVLTVLFGLDQNVTCVCASQTTLFPRRLVDPTLCRRRVTERGERSLQFDRVASDNDIDTLGCPAVVIISHLLVSNEIDDSTDAHKTKREEIQ